jgi:anti-sigma B factor antagonist
MALEPRRRASRADRRRREGSSPTGVERRQGEIPPVEVRWRNAPDGIVIELANVLVVSNCFPVRDQLEKYVEKFTARKYTLDISQVPYADSAGLGVLVELKARCMQRRKQFVVVNPTERVREILELLHLDTKLLS